MYLKTIICRHYEKILFIFSLISFVGICFITNSSQKASNNSLDNFYKVKTKSSGNSLFLYPQKVTELMPGQIFSFQEKDSTVWQNTEILTLKYAKRSFVEIFKIDGTAITGNLINEVKIDKEWQNKPDSIAIRSNKTTTFIPHKIIQQIKGFQELEVSESFSDVDWDNVEISFYQLNNQDLVSSPLDKTRWLAPKSDSNSTHYDLFTPPIIYIDKGRLTTRKPDKEVISVEREPFGLEFVRAYKSPYSFRLVSWVGTTPYFEDLESPMTPSSNNFTRNRIEVGKYYKRNINWKPGQPSLILCDQDDKSKKIMLENFVVQQHKNSKSGGLRLVGRALVKDFSLGGDSFEINSLMSEVFAGDFTYEFKLSLPDIPEEKLEFSNKEIGKEFSFSGRKFNILSINLDNKTIEITKNDPRDPENITKVFNY